MILEREVGFSILGHGQWTVGNNHMHALDLATFSKGENYEEVIFEQM